MCDGCVNIISSQTFPMPTELKICIRPLKKKSRFIISACTDFCQRIDFFIFLNKKII